METSGLLHLLLQSGLNEAESHLYLALLKSGPQRAALLAETSGVSRTNTYNVLEQLQRKGLVEKEGGGRKSVFRALHPQRLEAFFDEQQATLNSRREQLRSHLSRLTVDFSLAEGGPGVYRFEGKEGMIRVYQELIKDRIRVDSIVDRNLLRTTISDYNPEYIRQRVKYRIHSRIISPSGFQGKSSDQSEFREVRILDQKKFPFEMDLKITAKKVVMTTFRQSSISGMIIIDSEVIRNYQVLFEFLWGIAQKS